MCAIALLAGGCASGPGALSFASTENDRVYEQEFSRAFYRDSRDGQYEIVLVEDGIMPGELKPSGPLQTARTAPLNQVVCIRIMWRPLTGSKPDTPSATNAAIDWYVQTNAPAGRSDRLHYRGAGFVSVYGSGARRRFVVRSVRLDLADSTGSLQDPLGSSTVTGTIIADRAPAQVATALESLKQPTAPGAPRETASHEGPPPRAPTGP